MANILEKLNTASGGLGRRIFNTYVLHKTREYQKKYGFEIAEGKNGTWNNESDAFKHAYMQWLLAFYKDSDIATELGDMHEEETPDAPSGEKNMDLWNNAIGREIAEEMYDYKEKILRGYTPGEISDIAAQKIMGKMRSGEMITSPDDPRQFENMELERLQPSDKVIYEGEYTNLDEMNKAVPPEQYMNQVVENEWKMPTKEELDKKVVDGDLIYVESYKKADGTEVKGYYRRRPVK